MVGIIQERKDHIVVDYFDSLDNKTLKTKTTQHRYLRYGGISSSLSKLFLPVNYPHSVTADYLPYQIFDTIQALCSYLRGIISTRALLQGVGVGNQEATSTAAAVQWIIRDGAGMIGGLGLATWKGSQFDGSAKAWRLFADVINDIGLTLELISPLFPPSMFLALASLGNICKAMCGISAGATKAALTHHFARNNNHADLSSKESCQETAVNLIGLVMGLLIAPRLDEISPMILYSYFFLLTVLHVYANIRALRSVQLTTLNRERVDLVIAAYLSNKPREVSMTPVAISRQEDLWACFRLFSFFGGHKGPKVMLGARILDITLSKDVLCDLQSIYHDSNYILAWSISTPGSIAVVFDEKAESWDAMHALLQAHILHHLLLTTTTENTPHSSGQAAASQLLPPNRKNSTKYTHLDMNMSTTSNALEMYRLSLSETVQMFHSFKHTLAHVGWTDHVLVDMGSWRATWK